MDKSLNARADDSRLAEPSGPEDLPLVSVYTPNAVFWTTFLLSLLGGFVVSAINWSRLESPGKARGHIIIGAVVFIGLSVLVAAFPTVAFLVLLINLGAAWYLRTQTQSDIIEDAGVTRRIEHANAWGAVGIGVACAVVMGILSVALHAVMS